MGSISCEKVFGYNGKAVSVAKKQDEYDGGVEVAFLRFYDEQDFKILGIITQPRVWSNRLTVAAFLVALVNFGVEWYRRNRETNSKNQEIHRRAKEEQRRREDTARIEAQRAEEGERASRRARIEARCNITQIRYQIEPSESNRQALLMVLAVLEEYGETL